MSEASKLAALLLHLEMNPKEQRRYAKDHRYARKELKHFGLSQETIEVVMAPDLEEFGKLFEAVRGYHLATVGVVEQSRRRK